MKNILIVLPWLPYPLNSGGRQAVCASLKSIENDCNIVLTYPVDLGKSSKKWENAFVHDFENVKLAPFIASKKEYARNLYIKIEKRIANVLFKSRLDRNIDENFVIPNNWSPGFVCHISKLIDDFKIDIVQTEFIGYLSLVLALPRNVKKVFVHHELRFVRCRQFIENNKLEGEYYDYLYNRVLDSEVSLLNLYDAIVTLSDIDKAKLEDAGVVRAIFPSFAMVSSFGELKKISTIFKKLVFVAPQGHYPNVAGLDWFLNNCFDILLKKDDEWSLDIIGKWSSDGIKRYSKYKNIRFLGFVPSLREAMAGSIMIVPLTVGSGIRMKILEASMLGIPFISTTIGVEGLPFKDGTDCFIADDPGDMVNKIFRLYDMELQNRFALSANKKIQNFFSLEKLRQSRLNAY